MLTRAVHQDYLDATRRRRRDELRRVCDGGTPMQRQAVALARAGYGYEDIVHKTQVDITIARRLVLGV